DSSSNDLYVVAGAFQVVKYSSDGKVTVAAGSGLPGFSGDGGPAAAATFKLISGIAVDSMGDLFMSDIDAQRVRKVSPDGTINTIAGTGGSGFYGDELSATKAVLNQPKGLTVDPAGNLYFADYNNNAVREVRSNGTIITVAGGPFGNRTLNGGTEGGFGG